VFTIGVVRDHNNALIKLEVSTIYCIVYSLRLAKAALPQQYQNPLAPQILATTPYSIIRAPDALYHCLKNIRASKPIGGSQQR